MSALARLRIHFACGAIAAALALPASAAQPESVRTVLAIHAGAEDFPANLVLDAAIREALTPTPELPIDYFAEYLEADRFGVLEAGSALRDYIRRKYHGRRIDAIVAITRESLQFVLSSRAELFPHAPIVFMGLSLGDEILSNRDRFVTGLLVHVAYAETLRLVLTLHPATEQVFVVARSNYRLNIDAVRSALRPFSSRVRITYVNEQTVPDLLAAVRAVPRRSVILYIWHSQDEPGKVLYSDRVARLVAEAAPVPVYGTSDFYIGSGVVGGVMRGTRETGFRLGEMARRVLAGTRPQDIPIEEARLVPTFDWRQLRRWGIDPSSLPPGATIRLRVPTAWESYRSYILTAAAVVAVQLVLIAALLTQRARRRRAEEAIRVSEATLRESYERIRRLARSLIDAQEMTRAQIARDLHDDVCQDLVGVSMSLDGLRRDPVRVQNPQTRRALADVQQGVLAIVQSMRQLSHDLHPATLQLLGLETAIRAHCREVEKRYEVPVSFAAQGDLGMLPSDIALCLFRIAQEALRNATAHGQARHITVTLERAGAQVELTIVDDGRGFDLDAVRRSGSQLGLVTMEERASLAGGRVRIVTQPGMGTRIHARVPPAPGNAGPAGTVSPARADVSEQTMAGRP